ncbi:MAG: hypothetical protein M0Z94_06670 [Dehalococcoidales bacterium]|nr:hypothetical protein [Dehalococcoidales bacterium]
MVWDRAVGLLEALEGRARRYAAVQGDLHHSEQAVYFDLCEGGFYTLTVYLYVGGAGQVRQARFSAHLPGIPLDLAPLREVARALDVDDQAYLRPLRRRLVENEWRLPGRPIKLQPVAFLRAGAGAWVSGLVVENPFFSANPYRAVRTPAGSKPLGALHKLERLVCGLGSWHLLDDAVDYYYLCGFETVRTGGALVVDLRADWQEEKADRVPREGERPPSLMDEPPESQSKQWEGL